MAYEIVQADDGVTMPACSSRVDLFATAADQFNHQAKCPSDEGIGQHRQQLHHMCSVSKVEIEDIAFIRQSPICLLVGFKRRKREFSRVTAKLDAVDRCEATAIIDNL